MTKRTRRNHTPAFKAKVTLTDNAATAFDDRAQTAKPLERAAFRFATHRTPLLKIVASRRQPAEARL